MANHTFLVGTIGAREKDAGLRARRPDHDPSLRAAIVRERRRVVDQLEAEDVNEEADGWVVLIDDRFVYETP